MSPAEREARQMIADKKAAKAAEKAYNRSMTNTEEAQEEYSSKTLNEMANMARENRNRKANENTPNVDAMGNQTGFRKGGYVRAADGIAKRGKTRGKIC